MLPRVVAAWVLVALSAASAAVTVWVSSQPTGLDVRWYGGVFGLVWIASGALLVTTRPRNAVSWVMVVIGACQSLSSFAGAYGGYGTRVEPAWPAATYVAQLGMLYVPSLVLPGSMLLALYPDGHLPSRRWRLPLSAVVVGLTAVTCVGTFSQEAYDDIALGQAPLVLPVGWWTSAVLALGATVLVAGTLAIWVLSGVRLARARYPERQQLAWLVAFVVPLMIFGFVLPFGWALMISAVGVPVALFIGVLRYQTLGIVLRPALVYGLLTGIVIGVYLLVTALAGAVLDRGPLPGVVAAALVAVGLSPVRDRLQRGVDRFVYGERRDPLQAVRRLGDRVALSDEAELLPAVLATVTDALHAPGARVSAPKGQVRAAAGPNPEAADLPDAVVLPLRVAGRIVGDLAVAARAPGEAYRAGERRLLDALAAQVAAVVHALDLADSLEQERDRVLAATRMERDRLRRELHDGIGPLLSGTALGLQATDDALRRGRTDAAGRLVSRLRTELGSAVTEIRRIVDGLRPEVLDEHGLDFAVRQQAEGSAGSVAVELAVAELPPLPPEVETAAYRIASEALTNVTRHAEAQRARVALTVDDGVLTLTVADDGHGIGAGGTPGIGLVSMRQRAQQVGGSLVVDSDDGGTVVTARLPLPSAHVPLSTPS